MLTLYNTLSRKKEVFKPLRDNLVTMYNCGPTVYDYAHIGNLRGYVQANILRRTLESHGYEVRQIINITDVGHLTGDSDDGEDKIEKGAEREQRSVKDVIDFYTNAFLTDLRALGIDTDKIYKFPRATEHIPEQIALVQKLEEKGFTYQISDGIYFDTAKFADYGVLSGQNIDGLKSGARVELNPEKRNVTDFALWRLCAPEESRAQEWDSPWGVGFPGWHVECSAMSMKYLGETLDIHTGGIDHINIHHTNEIAQSTAATGKQFSRFWLHHEFVNVSGGKMAKSEDNFIRLETLHEHGFNPLDYRYLLLLAHYRSPINFSFDSLSAAARALSRLTHFYASLEKVESSKENQEYSAQFFNEINDDLNTPAAIAVMWNVINDESVTDAEKRATLDLFDTILGLDLESRALELHNIPEHIIALAEERELEKVAKNYTRADEIRAEIINSGFSIKDSKDGFDLERA